MPRAFGLSTGDLVKGPVGDAVYYINGTMKHVFPDVKTYMTWYPNFDGIKKVTVAELDMYTTGSPVAYRPGTNLVTHPNTARVYAVEPSGVLRWISDEATALALYGSNWAKWVRDIHELTFGNYTIGTDMTSTMHAKGTVLQKTGDATIYYFDGTNIKPFASSAAFDANNLDYDYVVQVSSLANYTAGSSITGAESFATISGSGTGSTTTGPAGTLTVALSPNTPAANTVLLGGAARVPMVTVRLTAGSTAVVVDQLVIERKGIASDAAFSSFDLLDGTTMLPLNDSSKTLNSAHQTTFNDDFTVPANTSWDVIVAANMASSLANYAGEYPAIGVNSITLKNNSTLSGALPLMGNVMLTNGTLTVGTATIVAGANNPSAATKQVGQKDYVVSSIKITNNSSATGQNMTLKSVTFTNNGSVSNTDVQNLRLVNANTGTTIGTVAAPTSDKVSFTNLNLSILKGNNVSLDLKLDIIGGSGRTIDYDVEKQGDVVVFDELRGFNILPTYTNVSAEPYFNGAIATVDNGKFRVESIAVSPQNIQENKNGVLVGKFKFVVEGEPINVSRFPIKFILNTSTAGANMTDITNVGLKDSVGTSIISGIDPTSNGWIASSGSDLVGTATSTDTFTLPVGDTTYSVYADLSSDFTANDTIQTQVNPAMITAKGDVTGDTLSSTDITPATDVTGTTMNVRSVDLNVSVAASPAAQTIVAGTSDLEVSHIVLDAATSGSDVKITQFKTTVLTTANAFPDLVTGFELFVGGVKIPVDSSSTAYSTAGSTVGGSSTTTLTIATGNLTIPAGQTKTVVVKADIGSGATSGSFTVGMQGGLTAVDSEGQSFTPDFTNGTGQSMALSSGGTLDLTLAQDPKSALAVGGTTANVGQFSLQARYENITLNAFGFSIGNPDGGYDQGSDFSQVETLELWESGGSSAVGTITVSGANATVTPQVNGVTTPIALAANAMKTYIVKAKFRDVTVPNSIAKSSAGMRVTLRWVDADGASAGSTALTEPTYSTAFNTFSTYKSVPTIALGSISADQATSVGNEIDLYKFSVTANGAGPIGLAKFSFSVSTSTSVRMSTTGYTLYMGTSSGDTSSVIADSGDIAVVLGGGNAGTTVHDLAVKFDYNHDTSATQTDADTGELIEISAGATRYFTLKGTLAALSATANDDSITTRMGGDAAFAVAGSSLINMGDIDQSVEHDDFIWSDLNFVSGYNSSTATYTVGWFNGYRVSGLDDNTTTPQTQTD